MSRAIPILPSVGGPRSASSVSGALTPWVSPSGLLDGDSNFAEEGVDERSIDSGAVHGCPAAVTSDTATTFSNTAFTTLVMGATTFQTAGFTVPADSVAHIVADITCECDGVAQYGICQNPATPAPVGGNWVEMELRTSSGGTPTALTGSTAYVGNDSKAGFGASDGSDYGDCMTFYEVGPGTYDWAEVRTRIVRSGSPDGRYNITHATLIVTIYKKGA